MPFNGAGTFTLVTPINPFVTGTTISAPDMNTTLSDLATNGLTNAVTRDGQSPLTANWPVGGFNITGIGTLSATTLNVSGTATIATLAGVTSLSLTTLTVTGAATVGTTLGVTGAITGSSTITMTGAATAASFIPSSATMPANGLYLAAANTPAFASNTTERLRFNSSGAWGIAGANYGTSGQVLTSGGSSAAPSWTTVSGYDPSGTAATPYRVSLPINSAANTIIVQAGSGTTNGSGDLTVTFATAFSARPEVSVTPRTANGFETNTYATWEDGPVSGVSIIIHSFDSGGNAEANIAVSWIAVGPA